MKRAFRRLLSLLLPLAFSAAGSAFAQQTNNSSSLTNSAAPSASSVTTGGTNINYQNNNQWSNEVGFGPGFFCRTPTFYTGGNVGAGNNSNFDAVASSGNTNNSYNFSFGLLVPFGSTVVEDCKRLAASIVKDREISSELSMLRTCVSLEREGIVVDPDRYPLLERCARKAKERSLLAPVSQNQPRPTSAPGPGRPAAGGGSSDAPLPPKIPQVTKS